VSCLSREGTLDREIFERVTALEVETVLAALTESRRGKYRAWSERGRRQGCQRSIAITNYGIWYSCKRELGRKLPTKPGDPLKRFERRETLDSSVLRGATFQVYAGRKS